MMILILCAVTVFEYKFLLSNHEKNNMGPKIKTPLKNTEAMIT